MKMLDHNFNSTDNEKKEKENVENKKDIKNAKTENQNDNTRNSVKLQTNIQKKKRKCC